MHQASTTQNRCVKDSPETAKRVGIECQDINRKGPVEVICISEVLGNKTSRSINWLALGVRAETLRMSVEEKEGRC